MIMTDQEINIAIAKVCGWTACEYVVTLGLCKGVPPKGYNVFTTIYPSGQTQLPSYTTDLNAMHEAEKTLTDDREGVYEAHIYLVCDVEPDTIFATDMRKVICATARQRAEAFLRTLGKWKE